MYQHYMLITQPISNTERIGWNKLITKPSDLEEIIEVKKILSELNIGAKFSSHLVSSESSDIESVKQNDAFFESVIFLDDLNYFIEFAKTNGEKLEALDIAKYILLLNPMTHLKLQKILYIAYERFYRKTGNLLYSNKILAFDYGPVTREVFNKYYRTRNVLKDEEDDESLIQIKDKAISPTVAKVMLSENGLVAMDIIKKVVSEYSDMNAWGLVDLTHRKGYAWDRAYNVYGRNTEITQEIIDNSVPI